jgi:hypothetical protein
MVPRQSKLENRLAGDWADALPVVETIAEKAMGFEDATESDPDDKSHLAPTGAPPHAKVIVPTKPFPGFSCKL